MLTHANLLANLQAMMQAADVSPQDVFVSWLPLYHDMGLIGAWLGSVYYGFHLVLMSPLTFLARPERWLAAIHTHRGTISGGPNFAYELCLRRIDDREIEGYDLSSWRIAFNGAEPVSPDTLQLFIERFAAYGFRPEAMAPVYGLAEGTLGLAFPPFESAPRIDRVKRDAFTRTGRALPAADRDADVLRFVSCGHPLPGHQIRIVDATGYELPERREGQLEFCGPSATAGYFRNPEDTRHLYHDAWVRSGDRAYIAEGEVFITGREKDLIIRAGRNIYPHELEEAVGAIAGIRKGCIAAFGSTDPVSGTERLVVLAETRETSDTVHAQLRTQIDACVVDLLGTPPHDVILVPPQSVLKTSSGKIRRSASRERYERGEIGARPSAMWRQVLRLAVASLWPQCRRSCRAALDIAYGFYVWGVFGVLATWLWGLLAVLPKRTWRQDIAHKLTRRLLRLVRIPLSVRGLEHLPAQSPYVLVCNHASYMDAVVLVAALPSHLRYVAKRELAKMWIPRLLFNRLGTEFVERFDAQQGLDDTAHVLAAVKSGAAVVFFPEGTFGREPGLRPFHMGAFMIAAQVGVPVVPAAIVPNKYVNK
jgi:1-acyl-sn-glycerol-3-phosphate acyltransferase